MLILPLLFARYGIKYILLGGMLAWAVRYALFALSAPTGITSLVFLGIILHGICYDLFFVAGQIYVDKKSTADIRSQAQGLLVLITYGLGMFIGAQVAGYIYNLFIKGPNSIVCSKLATVLVGFCCYDHCGNCIFLYWI